MYKLPRTVQIGPYTYRFRRSASVDHSQRWAETCYSAREIRFGQLCTPQELPSSLVHELVHAAASAYGVDLGENQVAALANGLTQALMNLKLLPKTLEPPK